MTCPDAMELTIEMWKAGWSAFCGGNGYAPPRSEREAVDALDAALRAALAAISSRPRATPAGHDAARCRPETCGGVGYDPCDLARPLMNDKTRCGECGVRYENHSIKAQGHAFEEPERRPDPQASLGES